MNTFITQKAVPTNTHEKCYCQTMRCRFAEIQYITINPHCIIGISLVDKTRSIEPRDFAHLMFKRKCGNGMADEDESLMSILFDSASRDV